MKNKMSKAAYVLNCTARLDRSSPNVVWTIWHDERQIGIIELVGKNWCSVASRVEPGLPHSSAPRKSPEEAIIALLNRHYRLLRADRQRAESKQEA